VAPRRHGLGLFNAVKASSCKRMVILVGWCSARHMLPLPLDEVGAHASSPARVCRHIRTGMPPVHFQIVRRAAAAAAGLPHH
jgi:hypothetical protein